MRVALFGGSFDPPHLGHMAVAEAAADAFALDRLLFAPAGRQPLKLGRAATGFADRLAMVSIACREDARFEPSSIDGPRQDGAPNYTVDTLARLREQEPGVELFCLVGMDSFLDMGRWREPEKLLTLAQWIVATRPGYLPGDAAMGRVHALDTVYVDLSATGLRTRLLAGEQCDAEMPPGIGDYIRDHALYQAR